MKAAKGKEMKDDWNKGKDEWMIRMGFMTLQNNMTKKERVDNIKKQTRPGSKGMKKSGQGVTVNIREVQTNYTYKIFYTLTSIKSQQLCLGHLMGGAGLDGVERMARNSRQKATP